MIPADQHYHFTVSVPAGTAKAAPIVSDMRIGIHEVTGFTFSLPSGHLGNVGFKVTAHGGEPVLPINGDFIVLHSSEREYPVSNLHDSGDYWLMAYNTGAFAHAIRVTIHANVLRVGIPTQADVVRQVGALANTSEVVTVPDSYVYPHSYPG